MPDHLGDHEIQEFAREFRVEVGLAREAFQPLDLARLAGGIGRRKVVFGLEAADILGVLEAFGQRIDQDRVQPVDAGAMLIQQGGGAGGRVGPALAPVAGEAAGAVRPRRRSVGAAPAADI